MRANGIPEARITGDADAYDKFLAFAETLPYPDDEETLAMLVRGICYQNAKEYFGL